MSTLLIQESPSHALEIRLQCHYFFVTSINSDKFGICIITFHYLYGSEGLWGAGQAFLSINHVALPVVSEILFLVDPVQLHLWKEQLSDGLLPLID